MLRFGTQTDTQPINGGPLGELTPERVAAYIAKYATKSADDFGVGDRRISVDAPPLLDVNPHVERIIRTAWDLGAHPGYDGIRRWLHMLGFRGHFAPPWAPSAPNGVRTPANEPPNTPSSSADPTREPHGCALHQEEEPDEGEDR